jgi:hypothetical protein
MAAKTSWKDDSSMMDIRCRLSTAPDIKSVRICLYDEAPQVFAAFEEVLGVSNICEWALDSASPTRITHEVATFRGHQETDV